MFKMYIKAAAPVIQGGCSTAIGSRKIAFLEAVIHANFEHIDISFETAVFE